MNRGFAKLEWVKPHMEYSQNQKGSYSHCMVSSESYTEYKLFFIQFTAVAKPETSSLLISNFIHQRVLLLPPWNVLQTLHRQDLKI